MSGAHTHSVYRHGHSRVHRLPAHVKLVAALAFTLTVVATPREQVWAFGAYAVLVGVAVAAARLRVTHVVGHLAVELPFVLFAFSLPFLTGGPEVSVLGVGLSRTGLWDGWNILAKATLGVSASLVLASTTSAHELLQGVQRLRAPSLFVQIMSFMVRYVDVVGGEVDRMRVARLSRGFRASRPGHWRVLAQSAGATFIRSYERGERVHLAMLSRGYTGRMPSGPTPVTSAGTWAYALVLPAATLVVAVAAWSPPW
ncbi:MAG: cobalt ECF transporter T component CbiQ [Nocardioidaceae bacterium]